MESHGREKKLRLLVMDLDEEKEVIATSKEEAPRCERME